MKKIIQSFWNGPKLSKMEKLTINSYLLSGYQFYLYTYNYLDVPIGTTLMDARDILSTDIFENFKNYPIAYFSDLFRFELLHKKGGYWVDMDMVMLKEYPDDDYVFCLERAKFNRFKLNVGFMKIPRNSKLMRECADYVLGLKKIDYWGQTGEHILQKKLSKYEDEIPYLNFPAVYFCPVNWWETNKLIHPKQTKHILKLIENSYGIHLYHQSWVSNGFNPDGEYPGTVYDYLCKLYL